MVGEDDNSDPDPDPDLDSSRVEDELDDPDTVTSSDWPVSLAADGVTESVVATLGPNERWNFAALGLRTGDDAAHAATVSARTWGRTRTRRNFEREGDGVVQFVDDPLAFVEAALDIVERETPVSPAAAAHVRVAVERLDSGHEGDTEWVDWALTPREGGVHRRVVPTIRRGFGATIEATVHASRLGVPAYDDAELRSRLAALEETVAAAGGDRERRAFDRIDDLVGWRDDR